MTIHDNLKLQIFESCSMDDATEYIAALEASENDDEYIDTANMILDILEDADETYSVNDDNVTVEDKPKMKFSDACVNNAKARKKTMNKLNIASNASGIASCIASAKAKSLAKQYNRAKTDIDALESEYANEADKIKKEEIKNEISEKKNEMEVLSKKFDLWKKASGITAGITLAAFVGAVYNGVKTLDNADMAADLRRRGL